LLFLAFAKTRPGLEGIPMKNLFVLPALAAGSLPVAAHTKKRLTIAGVMLALLLGTVAAVAQQRPRVLCDDNATLCTETFETHNYEGQYTGHDEPSLLFYSNKAGSGNSNHYLIQLPTDPPKQPTQDGTGGTFNFQLHPAFWFGMALCDTQSAPNPGPTALPCIPDSDTNIFDGTNSAAPDYIGKHPGTAFMEMQFYPPGWVLWPPGNSCDAKRWCAALNIDSLSENMNTGQVLNPTCSSITGVEYVNFAFITKNGVPIGPPNPVQSTLATFTVDPSRVLLMNSGDVILVDLHDTPHGLLVSLVDLTTGQKGSMVASAANGFGQVQFDPTGTSCNNIPYDFHPMYSTSSEHTRVPWAAHTYNIAFADEIGHWEYCKTADCSTGGDDTTGPFDDFGCLPASASSRVPVGGCTSTDVDFDGVPYQKVWPGTSSNVIHDFAFHPQPVRFTSPTFNGSSNYDRVAFETDLPRIEAPDSGGICNRTTGANCVNPPAGANFYPFFSTVSVWDFCYWQLGGDHIPGTSNDFGGSSTSEFGSLLTSVYPGVGGTPISRINNFRQVLSSNPCRPF
jgi:hypothetical protein